MRNYPCGALAAILAALCLFPIALSAQTPARQSARALDLRTVQPMDRITRPIEDDAVVLRPGNRHPLARPEFDAGAVPEATRMERMILALRPDAAQQQALEGLLAAQQDRNSPFYHQWLTPEDFGRLFGVSDNDLRQVADWLKAKGFEVEPVAEGRRQLVFSGTAAQVRSAFGTEIHEYRVRGQIHHANAGDPQIPATLDAVVGGIVSLHDFRAAGLHSRIQPAAEPAPQYSSGATHYVSPADFAAIYDLAPLYGSSTDGAGQSIAIVARTNLKLSDIQGFRARFGLPANPPSVIVNGPDPGVVSSDELGEAELDTEWSGAVAANASIQVVVSASTQSTDGVDLSAQYIVNHNLAPVVSLSFGSCESMMGSTENQFWNALWQQAAAQGMSVFVASGDSGAAGCDAPSSSTAVGGRGVNGLCSSPYATCVGGTQFADTSNPAQYWSSSNASAYSSALTYIPEAAWNESGSAGGSDLWSGGGGASSVYAKPSWQTGLGVPFDGHRDVPDVSLAAAGHDGFLLYLNGQFYVASGTSVAAPSFAGLMALVTGRQGSRQGNPNPVLYTLASNQASGGPAVFHDVTSGNNSVPGVAGYNAGAGYDLATGLGSVDANSLVNAWQSGGTPTPSLLLSAPAAAAVAPGTASKVAVTVGVSGGFSSAVTLSIGPLPAGLAASFAPAGFPAPGSGTSTLTVTAGSSATAGSYHLTITAAGGGLTKTAALAVTVAPSCTYALSSTGASAAAAGGSSSFQVSTAAGCPWTASANAAWIALTGAASGSGPGTVAYTVAANTTASVRTGAITAGGRTFALTQAAAASFSLNPGSASYAAAGGTGSVAVTAPSASSSWTAKSSVGWIVVTGGGSGAGNGTVRYSVAANTSNAARSGALTIAGLTFVVTQAGPACTYAISVGPVRSNAAGFSGTIAVSAGAGCAWTAASTASWITIVSGASGSGNGAVSFLLAANNSSSTRTGTLVVAGYTLTIGEGPRGNVGISRVVRAATR